MNSRKSIFKASGLAIGYRQDQRLFENLSVELKEGDLVCFMGPNGVGKSSVIKTLAGLIPPLAGKVDNTNERNVAVVLTDRIQAPQMTVRELITYGRYPYLDWNLKLTAEDHRIIDESISRVHVQHLLDKYTSELSDGQMQMVMIARALVQNTPVLLLDEPTAHLDLNNRLEIMNVLRTLARTTGKAILLATHELDLALQTADYVWLASPDRRIRQGIPEDLVLDGSFDEVFQFKGFDLKTGKVIHESFRQQSVKLVGSGSEYLWTKNALERSGFDVTNDTGPHIELAEGKWKVEGKVYETLELLIQGLSKPGSW